MKSPVITAALTLSLTGQYERQGIEAAEGVRLWAQEADIRLILADDHGSRSMAVDTYAGWIDGVDLLLGPYASGLVRAVAPLVRVYYEPGLIAGSQLERPIVIPDGVHAELRRLGVRVTRFVEDFMGARLPDPEEERALQLPSGVPVTRNIRTAYAGDQPIEVLDTVSHGEVVSHRFEIEL